VYTRRGFSGIPKCAPEKEPLEYPKTVPRTMEKVCARGRNLWNSQEPLDKCVLGEESLAFQRTIEHVCMRVTTYSILKNQFTCEYEGRNLWHYREQVNK
jgi:hypothetical protein